MERIPSACMHREGYGIWFVQRDIADQQAPSGARMHTVSTAYKWKNHFSEMKGDLGYSLVSCVNSVEHVVTQ